MEAYHAFVTGFHNSDALASDSFNNVHRGDQYVDRLGNTCRVIALLALVQSGEILLLILLR